MGDMKARVGDGPIEGVVGPCGEWEWIMLNRIVSREGYDSGQHMA